MDMRFVSVRINGAPYQPNERIRVVRAVDGDIYSVHKHIGKTGVVRHLDYSRTVGQQFPHDPMINVLLEDGQEESFWCEELEAANEHSQI